MVYLCLRIHVGDSVNAGLWSEMNSPLGSPSEAIGTGKPTSPIQLPLPYVPKDSLPYPGDKLPRALLCNALCAFIGPQTALAGFVRL
jgi:hypothetical protein